LLEIAVHARVVQRRDAQFLLLGCATAQLVRARRRRGHDFLRVPGVDLLASERFVGDREPGVDLNGTLVERDRHGVIAPPCLLDAKRVRSQRVERARRRLFDRRVEPLNRLRRLTEFLSKLDRDSAERGQYFDPGVRFDPLARQQRSGLAVQGIEGDDISSAERCDRTGDPGFDTSSLADLQGHLTRQPLFG
jgi:hypothetical protein